MRIAILLIALLFAFTSVSNGTKTVEVSDTTVSVSPKFYNGVKLKKGQDVKIDSVLLVYAGNTILRYKTDTVSVPDTLYETRTILVRYKQVIIVTDDHNSNFFVNAVYSSEKPNKRGDEETWMPLESQLGSGWLKVITNPEYGMFCVIAYPNGTKECVYAFRK